jgi:hypothetical protein
LRSVGPIVRLLSGASVKVVALIEIRLDSVAR